MVQPEEQQAIIRPVFYPSNPDLNQRCREVFNEVLAVVAVSGEAANNSLTVIREQRFYAFEIIDERLQNFGQPVRLALSVLCDLLSQGWSFVSSDDNTLRLGRPSQGENRSADKERVRRCLLLARDEQLCEPAVRTFVKVMETRRLGPKGWCSVMSLMRDGTTLSQELRAAAAVSDSEKEDVLAKIVQPYIQVVNTDERDEHTGLRLSDIWRYFRYTWLTPARTVPGRTMMVLVRDAAAQFHPIIGIAALSSSIVQQSERDRVIGWTRERVIEDMLATPTDEKANWLLRSLEEALSGLHTKDLITADELKYPTSSVIARIHGIGVEERSLHQNQAKLGTQSSTDSDWSNVVNTHLFRSKRALTLSALLGVRLTFREVGLTEPCGELLRQALSTGGETFKQAIARVIRQVKAARVGINMMDISVCGSLAPYNVLLGGKLVSMLMASPEIRVAYASRYQAASLIASGMKGEAVLRRPDLVLLCTTGLFAGGSSQYNRVRIPKEALQGSRSEVRYEKLEQETEYATFHISQATMEEMRLFAKQTFQTSRVNSIFGEGVNPKMRKIRESLAAIGFPPDEILKAGSPRAVYMVPLAQNYQALLLGQTDKPEYLLESETPTAGTKAISSYWRRRWLARRINNPDILREVARNTLTYPLIHGAMVTLPEAEHEQLTLEGFHTEQIDVSYE